MLAKSQLSHLAIYVPYRQRLRNPIIMSKEWFLRVMIMRQQFPVLRRSRRAS